ncbi:MAG: TIGR03016 family PEP-CTERM system-associated outer membrane protein [Rhodospirillales bacterium]|nr:TIGR03016 family PEP-CTERM system-associated outer membrane protein [Rhodospirillales bacterium]
MSLPSSRPGRSRGKAAYFRGLAAFGAGLAGLVVAAPAWAQSTGLLPSNAAGVNLGNLRQAYDSALSTLSPTPQIGFTITPAISLSGFFADPVVAGSRGSRHADVGTIISPSLLVSGQSPRLQGTLLYSPQATFYAQEGSANRIGQNFNGNLHAILVPDTLFLDARGTGSMTLGQGGYSSYGASGLSPQQLTQTYGFQIAPLLQHRFDGTGIAELGYTYAETVFENGNNVPTTTPFGTVAPNQNQITNAAHVGFTSGENFGRIRFSGLLSGSQSTGGSLGASHRNLANVDLAYGITREIIILGSVGYEDLHYGGTAPINIRGMTWSAGTRLLPNPKSSITVTYGRYDGANSVSFDGSYQLGTRLLLSGRYSKGISSAAEDLQSALASSRLDPYGNPIDAVTGVPLMLQDNFFGISGTVDRIERYSASIAYLLPRDVVTLGARTDHNRVLSSSAQTASGPTSTSGTYFSLAWQHDLSPTISANTSYQYGIRTGAGSTQTPGTSTEYIHSFSLGASWRMSKTLTTSALYALDITSSRTAGYDQTTHYVIITLNKQF